MTETIGDRIRKERETLHISRADLADFAGLAPTTLADLENGYQKTTTRLHKIAQRLFVRLDWLETGKGPKSDTARQAGDKIPADSDLMGLSQTEQQLLILYRNSTLAGRRTVDAVLSSVPKKKQARDPFLTLPKGAKGSKGPAS